MIQKLYIDKGVPLVICWPEKLTDGSIAWQIGFRGGETLYPASEKKADQAFELIAAGIKLAHSGGDILIL